MRGENNTKRGMVRGYLFEAALRVLLVRSGFHMVRPLADNADRVRLTRTNFLEIKGRGAWHQIDCPFDYGGFIPFLYPVRLIGEAKFLQTEVQKSAIRSFIGVMRDIQENYYVDDSLTGPMLQGRRLELGAFFAANGVTQEAERLAYAHGIRTISYRNNRAVAGIKDQILLLEERYIKASVFSDSGLRDFLPAFEELLRGKFEPAHFAERFLVMEAAGELERLVEALWSLKTSFLASTDSGVLLHVLSEESFPEELFEEMDTAVCRAHYVRDDMESQFYLQFAGDERKRRFYFTPPESLQGEALYGRAVTDGDKEGKILHTQVMIKGLRRSLDIQLDQDWLEAQRELNMSLETV